MGFASAATDVPTFERGCAPVYFVKGIADITDLGNGNILISYFRPGADGHEIEVKLVCHMIDIEIMIGQVNMSFANLRSRPAGRVMMM